MKLHLLGLPHTQLSDKMSVCAFTTKSCKFVEMMKPLGYEIVTYWGEENDTNSDEHVVLFSNDEQKQWYGEMDLNMLPSKATWDHDKDESWQVMNARVVQELASRVQPRDLILVLAGRCQQPIANFFPNHLSVEWAAGYSGIFSKYVCFESYAWMHYLYGTYRHGQGRFYDVVIPNFMRPYEFSIAEKKDDYLLYCGRVTPLKGVQIAVDIAKRLDKRLIIAGSGVIDVKPGKIICEEMTLEGDHIEYVGTVNAEQRNELMSKAQALLAPTTYIEPFGAVILEANFSGTPSVTTDWGAFSETIHNGINGYRFRTLAEGVEATKKAVELDPVALREYAVANYSLDVVGPRYDAWFKRLQSLWGAGWYA